MHGILIYHHGLLERQIQINHNKEGNQEMTCKEGCKLLYGEEHFSCSNYGKEETALVRIVEYTKGEVRDRIFLQSGVAFVLKGNVRISVNGIKDFPIGEEKMLVSPMGSRFRVEAMEDTTVLVFHMKYTTQLCESFRYDNLAYEQVPDRNSELKALSFNPAIRSFISDLMARINDGLTCRHYLEHKLSELFFLLRAYYTKEDLAAFFYRLMTSDLAFRELVVHNYSKAKSVKDLADMAHYSETGFHKRFKKVFGESPSDWLNREKANKLRHELAQTQTPLKIISDKFDFSSASHLNKFCRKHFGATPLEIRSGKR